MNDICKKYKIDGRITDRWPEIICHICGNLNLNIILTARKYLGTEICDFQVLGEKNNVESFEKSINKKVRDMCGKIVNE